MYFYSANIIFEKYRLVSFFVWFARENDIALTMFIDDFYLIRNDNFATASGEKAILTSMMKLQLNNIIALIIAYWNAKAVRSFDPIRFLTMDTMPVC